MNEETSKRAALSMPIFLLLGACSTADPSAGSGEPSVSVDTLAVVATVKPSDQQTIEVMQYGNELMGIVETRGANFDPTKAVSLANFKGASMAEFYAAVAGGAVDRAVFDKLTAHGIAARKLGEELAREGVDRRAEPVVQDLEAEALLDEVTADAIDEAAPGVHTLATGLPCAQNDLTYTRYASGWGSNNCPNPRGWEDAWCKTDESYIEKGLTHGERWWHKAQNMSKCNTASLEVRFVNGWNRIYYAPVTLGPNGGTDAWWEVSNRDWRYGAKLKHASGNEFPHLNYVLYRQW